MRVHSAAVIDFLVQLFLSIINTSHVYISQKPLNKVWQFVNYFIINNTQEQSASGIIERLWSAKFEKDPSNYFQSGASCLILFYMYMQRTNYLQMDSHIYRSTYRRQNS